MDTDAKTFTFLRNGEALDPAPTDVSIGSYAFRSHDGENQYSYVTYCQKVDGEMVCRSASFDKKSEVRAAEIEGSQNIARVAGMAVEARLNVPDAREAIAKSLLKK